MNKFFILAATLMLSAPNAFASKARLISLGQDPNGSSYIDDTRSVFLNPAYINTVGDFADFEFGSADGTTTSPKSEGGFFHKWDGYHVGLQLGRQTDFSDAVAEANNVGGNAFVNPQNTIELQLGSGDSYKWGASLLYGMTENRTNAGLEKKASAYEFRGGLMHNSWDVYAALDVLGSAEINTGGGASNKLTENPSFKLGGAFELTNEEKLFLESRFLNYKTNNGTPDSAQSVSSVNFGYAHFLSPEAVTHFFYTVSLSWSNDTAQNTKMVAIPLVVGLETAATDWLKLRASVTQNVIIDQKVTSTTNTNNPNSTVVAGGVGINWKKITIDGTLAGSTGGSAYANTGTSSGNINATELLANASMTYMF